MGEISNVLKNQSSRTRDSKFRRERVDTSLFGFRLKQRKLLAPLTVFMIRVVKQTFSSPEE